MPTLAKPLIVKINEITVTLRRYRLAKSLRLRIDPLTRNPILSVPNRLSLKHIESFLWRHEEWIRQQLAVVSVGVQTNEVLFKGKVYQLVFQPTLNRRLAVNFDHLQQVIYHNCATDLIKSRLKPIFKRESLNIIQFHCQTFATGMGLTYKNIQIKDYKSRWGSCRQNGELSFSWRLIMAPPEILEYVCAHEVAHLIHMNHSSVFWQCVATLFPTYKKARTWLKENGKSLFQQF